MSKKKYKITWGVAIYEISKMGFPIKKTGERRFKSEKDLAYFLYKYE